MATMPNVVGDEYQEATDKLIAAGVADPNRWSIFAVTTINIDWKPSTETPGTVLAQEPASGTTVAVNSPVTLTVADFTVGVVYP